MVFVAFMVFFSFMAFMATSLRGRPAAGARPPNPVLGGARWLWLCPGGPRGRRDNDKTTDRQTICGEQCIWSGLCPWTCRAAAGISPAACVLCSKRDNRAGDGPSDCVLFSNQAKQRGWHAAHRGTVRREPPECCFGLGCARGPPASSFGRAVMAGGALRLVRAGPLPIFGTRAAQTSTGRGTSRTTEQSEVNLPNLDLDWAVPAALLLLFVSRCHGNAPSCCRLLTHS